MARTRTHAADDEQDEPGGQGEEAGERGRPEIGLHQVHQAHGGAGGEPDDAEDGEQDRPDRRTGPALEHEGGARQRGHHEHAEEPARRRPGQPDQHGEGEALRRHRHPRGGERRTTGIGCIGHGRAPHATAPAPAKLAQPPSGE
ncbi:MAG: hypothetical protein ACXWCB_05180 [Acidimicrobiales bacterium]